MTLVTMSIFVIVISTGAAAAPRPTPTPTVTATAVIATATAAATGSCYSPLPLLRNTIFLLAIVVLPFLLEMLFLLLPCCHATTTGTAAMSMSPMICMQCVDVWDTAILTGTVTPRSRGGGLKRCMLKRWTMGK